MVTKSSNALSSTEVRAEGGGLEDRLRLFLQFYGVSDAIYAEAHNGRSERVLEIRFTVEGGFYWVEFLLERINTVVLEDAQDARDAGKTAVQAHIWVVELLERQVPAPLPGGSALPPKLVVDAHIRAEARLSLNQLRQRIAQASSVNQEYFIFSASASIIAAVGLGNDDVVATVASMLISPLMGPVLGMTFGVVMGDWGAACRSLLGETQGLLCCIIVGFLVGIIVGRFAWEDDWGWPTPSMHSRGEWWSLLIGLAIAVPSGVGVAYSICSANTGGLVGVAISASLLPPAVNCGLCWGYAAVAGDLSDEPYDRLELVRMGGVSLLLTLVNILAIVAVGSLSFVLNRVAPGMGTPTAEAMADLKVANGNEEAINDKTKENLKKEIDRNPERFHHVRATMSLEEQRRYAADLKERSIMGSKPWALTRQPLAVSSPVHATTSTPTVFRADHLNSIRRRPRSSRRTALPFEV